MPRIRNLTMTWSTLMKASFACAIAIVGLTCPAIAQDSESSKFAIQYELRGYRSKAKEERNIMMQGILGRMIPYPNPSVYAILKIEGKEDVLIPKLEKEAEGRTVLLNFTGSKDWSNKPFILELWEDGGESDAFWKAVIYSVGADVNVSAPKALPVEVGAVIRVKADKEAFNGAVLTPDRFVAQFKSTIPESGINVAGALESEIKPTLLFGTAIPTKLGTVTLKNLGNP